MSTHGNRNGIVPIFATPFASIDTGSDSRFNARLARLCEAQRRETESGRGHDPLHFRGPADFMETGEEPAIELKRLVLGHAMRMVDSINAPATSELEGLRADARAWCSIVQFNGHIPSQQFPGASWVAVYCVQSGEPGAGSRDSGILRIHETRLSSVYRDASTWGTKPPYRYGHYSWSPRPGFMAFFPAHVRHEISVVRSSTPLILVFALIRFIDANARDNRYGS